MHVCARLSRRLPSQRVPALNRRQLRDRQDLLYILPNSEINMLEASAQTWALKGALLMKSSVCCKAAAAARRTSASPAPIRS